MKKLALLLTTVSVASLGMAGELRAQETLKVPITLDGSVGAKIEGKVQLPNVLRNLDIFSANPAGGKPGSPSTVPATVTDDGTTITIRRNVLPNLSLTNGPLHTTVAAADIQADPKLVTQPAADPKLVTQPAADSKLVTQPTADPKLVTQPVADPKLAAQPAADPKLAAQPAADPKLAAQPVADPKLAAQPAADPKLAALPVADPKLAALPVADPKLAALPVADPKLAALPTGTCPTCPPPKPTPQTAEPLTYPIVTDGKNDCLLMSPATGEMPDPTGRITIACGNDSRVVLQSLNRKDADKWLQAAPITDSRLVPAKDQRILKMSQTIAKTPYADLLTVKEIRAKDGTVTAYAPDGLGRRLKAVFWYDTTQPGGEWIAGNTVRAATAVEKKARSTGMARVLTRGVPQAFCHIAHVFVWMVNNSKHDNCGSDLGNSDEAKQARSMDKNQLREALIKIDPTNAPTYNNSGRRALMRDYLFETQKSATPTATAADD